ncbi:ABC transporter permease [Urbifossiella limnaea]|uniref:ABC-2 family transporter protein n=1 Tax=Urbifossiella limnaea TaxID=2528023 RepID=A0A517XZN6_9BACT|nr:ABC transporter permease [Urbifossiella limnaea]QDU22975.1 ABC-2 family transporter protein [Urbifossiella limnaea]
MVRAIVWKEFREQGLIGLTLVVLGGGVLVAVAVLADPPQKGAAPGDVLRGLGPGPLTTLLLAVTAGTVCGGALFAAEREAGTHGFLDALPVPRAGLWTAKLLAGGLLAASQAGLVIAAGYALGLLATTGWAFAVAVYSMLAFCWGTLGSTLARTTLGSVGVAVPAATLFAIAYLLPITLVFATPGSAIPRPAGAFLFLGLMFATPLLWSAAAYTRPDRAREADDRVPPPPAVYLVEPAAPVVEQPVRARRSRFGLQALLWLAARQLTGPGVTIAGFAVAAGLTLLLPTIEPFVAWPALGLLAGVFAGITAFSDEQTTGSARFWGEQRLPAGRMWLVKVLVHLAFALLLAALVALPSAVRAVATGGGGMRAEALLSAVFRSLMFEPRVLGTEGWKYLLAPVGYGFAAGVLCGMLFKKPVVGAGVAGVAGGTAFAAVLPGLLTGGTRHLWLWLPPLLALAAGRALLAPWGAERVATRRGLGPLIGGTVAAVLAVAAGAAYRAVEVPDRPGATDDVAYVEDGLVTFQQNDTGRQFRAATEQFARVAALVVSPVPGKRNNPADRVEQLRGGAAVRDDADLAEWVQAVYDADRLVPGPGPLAGPAPPPHEAWFDQAAAAADPALPVAVFEHPRLTRSTSGSPTLESGRGMAVVVLAHGLYRQTAGDPAAFAADLRAGLAVARSLRNGSLTASLHRGNDVTALALAAVGRWLSRVENRPELLRAVLDEVLRDERALMTRLRPDGTVAGAELPATGWGEPFDPTPHQLADRYVVRELMKAPSEWLPAMVTPPGRDKDAPNPEVDLVSFAWSVPWERERTRRLVAYGLDPTNGDDYRRLTLGRPGAAMLTARTGALIDLGAADRALRVARRGLAAALACRLYHHDRGTFPPDLSALVPAYLPEVPPDPYAPAGTALRYRVPTADELLQDVTGTPPGRGAPPPVQVKAGQPVIWSVGPDGADGGGRSAPFVPGTMVRGADVVFLVPLPPDR